MEDGIGDGEKEETQTHEEMDSDGEQHRYLRYKHQQILQQASH